MGIRRSVCSVLWVCWLWHRAQKLNCWLKFVKYRHLQSVWKLLLLHHHHISISHNSYSKLKVNPFELHWPCEVQTLPLSLSLSLSLPTTCVLLRKFVQLYVLKCWRVFFNGVPLDCSPFSLALCSISILCDIKTPPPPAYQLFWFPYNTDKSFFCKLDVCFLVCPCYTLSRDLLCFYHKSPS